MCGVQLAARPRALAFVSAACSLLSCALAQTPGASPLAPLFPGFSTEAPSSDASSGTGDFGALGAFDTARSRVFIPATDGTAPPVAGVPDLGGEQGEVLCTHPVVAGGARDDSEPDVLFPLVLYLHPTHGLVFEAWIAQNDSMLRLLASRGFVVCAPTMVGSRDGQGAESPIVGGLFPGAQHTAAVIERRVYPRTLAFAARAAPQLLRLGRVVEKGGSSSNDGSSFERLRNTSLLLSRRTDPSRVAFAGFSAGAALATYAADALDRVWPGATRAVVALAPTVGDFQFARSKFDLAAERLRVPTMLVAGAKDGMGGLTGLAALGDALKRAPRVGVAVAGATHCHLYIPVGSECDALDAANDAGGIGKLGRFVTSAFLHAYLGFPEGFPEGSPTQKTAAIDVVWGGADALNRAGAGAWNARVVVEPLVELGLGGRDHGARVATASYAYDPVHDAWTARVPLRVAAKERGCLTEARVVRVESESDEFPQKTDRQKPSFLRAFLDANDTEGGYPPQPIGVSVLVFPGSVFDEYDDREGEYVTDVTDESRTVREIDLVLEWRADAFDARDQETRLRDPARFKNGRRLLGGAGGPKADDVGTSETSETSEVFPMFPDVFVDGEVAWPSSDPMAETTVRAFGAEFEGARGSETKTNDSTVLKPVFRLSETVRVRALDACDGGTAAFLTLEVASPRLARTHRMTSFDESDDYAVGAFGAHLQKQKQNTAVSSPVSSQSETDGSETVASATSWEDALVRETKSRWDAFSG